MKKAIDKTIFYVGDSGGFANTLALFGLYLFAFGFVLSKAVANAGLLFLFIGFLLNAKENFSLIKRDRLFILSIIWALYLGFVVAIGAFDERTTLQKQLDSFLEVFSFGAIFLGAWAIGGSSKKIKIILLLALAGLVIRIFIDAKISAYGIYLDPAKNIVFSTNKNFAAVLIDASLVGVVLAAFYFAKEAKENLYKLVLTFLAFIPIFFAWGTINSRAAWLSLAVSLLLLSIFFVLLAKRGLFCKKTALYFTLFLVLFALLAAALFGKQMALRFLSEGETWRAIMEGRWEEIPKTSIGLRIYMWHYAFELWLESPLFGHGTSVAHLLETNSFDSDISGFNNFHNVYLELLVRVGIVGVLFFVAALFIVAKSLHAAFKRGDVNLLLFLYLTEVLLLFLLNSFSVGFLFVQHGWQYIFLFGSIAYGFEYKRAKQI